MTPAALDYQRAGARLRIARARLLLQISGADRDCSLADLLEFAGVIGDCTAADNLPAFRAAQASELQAAEAELARLAAK